MDWEKHLIRFCDGILLTIAVGSLVGGIILIGLFIIDYPLALPVILFIIAFFYGIGYKFGQFSSEWGQWPD